NLSQRIRARWWLPTLLVLGWLALATVPGRTQAPPSRQQQIDDIERQLKELTKKLEELRKTEPVKPAAPPEGALPESWVKTLTWRALGPAAMGGRITALSVFEADPTTYWVATA